MLPKSLRGFHKNSPGSLKKQSEHNLFYVRGFQRSGTNWVCNLLNLHPDVNCKGEFHLRPLFTAKNSLLKKEKRILAQPQNNFEDSFNEFIHNLITKTCGNFKFCGDRTPCSIESCYLPDTKTILIQRDGRDVLISWIYHLFRIDHKFGPQMERRKELFQKNPDYFEANKKKLLNNYWTAKISREWNKRVLQDHLFYNNISIKERQNIKIIKYEDLLVNTDLIRHDLYKFLGTDHSKAKKLNKLTSPGFKNHNANSHYRFGKSNRWSQYFTEEQSKIFSNNAGEALNLLEYRIK